MRRTAEAEHRGGRASTRTEILAVLSALVVLAALAVPWLVDARLKNIGLSFRIIATGRSHQPG